jgi:hypothetical protein
MKSGFKGALRSFGLPSAAPGKEAKPGNKKINNTTKGRFRFILSPKNDMYP